ncbi:hypothetical protein MRX96_042151 [Rhipicephalus microplus]
MTFPTSVQRISETDEEQKCCSGTERPFDTCPFVAKTLRNQPISQPFNTIRGGFNCVICCGVAGDSWSINHALETPRQSCNTFVTEDTEEELCRALRGHFMLPFGAGQHIRRRFPFHGPHSRPRRLFVIAEGKRVLSRRRSIPSSWLPMRPLPFVHSARLRDSWWGIESQRSQKVTLHSSPARCPSIDVVLRRCCRSVGATRASIGT